MERMLLMFVTASFIKCDWVEIPQSPVVIEKGTKRLDFTSYILTTTSTTTQTPIFAKPTAAYKKGHVKRITVSIQSNKIDTISSVKNVSSDPPKQIYNKTKANEVNKNATYLKNDTDAEEIDDDVFYEDDEEEVLPEEKEDIKQGFSYATFIPYMSVIQSALMKNAHNNKKSKVGVLQSLRDHLLSEIQNRISSLWKPTPKSREAREYKDDDSHVDFPSNEGALMTIGFLTFAVFLIKLVLQLIQSVGNNDNGTTTTTIIGRKRRSIDLNEKAAEILNYIDQYRFKNLDF
ncbi:hypothetical protein ILUMI_07175 [Ignelater luminosus]|uniref:Uncharacterized protein n=1 Tax=Ignelater luminosus TaxID=2038154 RepID=A0A8K0D8T9_IGNLU|nr:hypothetical protein ILUMI_07175 [Ignelater luminosus]